MAKQRKQSLLNGALILSAAIIAVKIISVFFKLYVTLKIGYDGKGYYAAAYNIYTPVYSIALAGLPTAVSKMVSSMAAQNRYRDVKRLFGVSLSLFTFMGVVGTVAILLFAYPYAKSVGAPDAMPAIVAIAPSLFFCCVMSGYRGYYQGLRDMVPSAVSQTFEAAGKLIFGFILINLVAGSGVVFADRIPILKDIVTDTRQAYAAAAAIAGVTIGSLMGLLYLMIRHRAAGDGISPEQLLASPESESARVLTRQLLTVAIPVALSSLVFNVTTLIDNWTVQNRLIYVLTKDYDVVAGMYPGIVEARGFTAGEPTLFKTYLFGAYDTVLEIKNIVPTFTITLGLSAIPVISEAWTVRDLKSVRASAESVIRLTMLLAAPAGAGMFALSGDILYLLYGQSQVNAPAGPYIAPILMAYGISVIFLALAEPLTNILQAIDRTDVPIKAIAIGAVVKLAANFIFVSIPSVNIQGAVIGSILCNIVMVTYSMAVIAKETELRYDFYSDFFKPLICAAFSGSAASVTASLMKKYLPSDLFASLPAAVNARNVSTVAAVAVAVLVYGIALLCMRAVTAADISMLPKGRKIAKVLEKYKLIG